jgi:peptidoglycan hydrolase-like protein with peptidoglycan-binding domain
VDGIYGPETVQAVQALQEAHGLPVTGTVDRRAGGRDSHRRADTLAVADSRQGVDADPYGDPEQLSAGAGESPWTWLASRHPEWR